MTRDRRLSRTKPNSSSDRGANARAATTTGALKQGTSALIAPMPAVREIGIGGEWFPTTQPLGVLGRPKCPDTASIKDPGAFNAHSSTASGSGLVQSVFSLPARLPTWVPARGTSVRRAAKLKTLFIQVKRSSL